MTIGPADVRHVAHLAEIAVPDADLERLAAQLQQIVAFVDQLSELKLDAGDALELGPPATLLRADIVAPIPMSRAPAEMAPAFQDGFYVVPRLGGLDAG